MLDFMRNRDDWQAALGVAERAARDAGAIAMKGWRAAAEVSK